MRLVDAVSLRSRRRKLRLFLDELRPTPETTVLDVGADELGFGEGDGCRTLNFFEEEYPWPEQITALGLHDGARFRERYPGIRYVQGDACALPFADGEFDVVFSNAVIEHVGGKERQKRFVSEALRVGRRAFPPHPPPSLPDRGSHAAALRPLASAPARARGLRRDGEGLCQGHPSALEGRAREPLPRTGARRRSGADAGGHR